MRTKKELFKSLFGSMLLASLLLTSCGSGEETTIPDPEPDPKPEVKPEETSDALLTSFSVKVGDKSYDALIPKNSTILSIYGVEHGTQITDVTYKTLDGTTLTPDPKTFIGNWDEAEKFEVKRGDKKINYTIRLVNYDDEYPIKQYGDIVIQPEEYFGNKITEYYYDIKFLTKWVQDEEMARELFVDDKMNGVRLPILGNDSKKAHPEAGVVVASMYDQSVATVENARKVIGDSKFTIFASKKLDGKKSFPEWTKDADGVIPAQYATLLIDYIVHMKSRGIEIDVLGVDNEAKYNEGNITPQKHYEIVNLIREASVKQGFKMPLIIGPEEYEPIGNVTCWIKGLYDLGYSKSIDIYGTHYYPRVSRNKEELMYELNIAKDKPFWATEPHWDNDDEAKADMLTASEMAICTLWDQTDLGMSGFMWWGYELNKVGTLKASLTKGVSTPILNTQPVEVYDFDGKDIMKAGNLQTRAFRDGNTIHLFVINVAPINDTAGKPAYNDYTIGINSGEIDGEVSCVQWRDNTPIDGVASTISSFDNCKFKFDFPVRSITRFSFNIK